MTAATPESAGKPPLPSLAPRALLRYDVVSRILRSHRPHTLLEAGCGLGGFGARVAASGIEYLGVEPDPVAFEVAGSVITPHGGTVLNGFVDAAPQGATYDMVCAFEVLEHIEDHRAALSDWVERIGPGGRLVLSVPAFQDRFGPMDTMAGHFRRYSPEQMTDLLQDAGLSAPSITLYAWPLGYALEAVRNRIDARKLEKAGPDASMAELTAKSGRTFQPNQRRALGTVIRLGVAPFQLLQRLRPTAGIGMVAVATKAA